MRGLKRPELKKENKLKVLDSNNVIVEIPIHECQHCMQMIPTVGDCPECGDAYTHLTTVENFKTGCLHYIYECSGCPENERRAQKIIKITDDFQESKSNRAKELAHEFLKSGGY